jgi:hypothetical protein
VTAIYGKLADNNGKLLMGGETKMQMPVCEDDDDDDDDDAVYDLLSVGVSEYSACCHSSLMMMMMMVMVMMLHDRSLLSWECQLHEETHMLTDANGHYVRVSWCSNFPPSFLWPGIERAFPPGGWAGSYYTKRLDA